MKNTINLNKSQIKSWKNSSLISFYRDNYRGDIYKVLQSYAYQFKTRIKTMFNGKISISVPRSYSASFAGCHVDTVSSCNMRLEEAGFLTFDRAYKKVNIITCHSVYALLEFFGYLPEWIYFRLSSASLLDLKDLNYLNTISLEDLRRKFLEFLTQKGENLWNLGLAAVKYPPVVRQHTPVERPYGDVCQIKRSEQCSWINTNLLFNRKEDEAFKVDWTRIKGMRLEQHWTEKYKQVVKKIDFQKTEEFLKEMIKKRWSFSL